LPRRLAYDLPDKLHDVHRFISEGEDFGQLVNSQEEMAARIIDLSTDNTKRLQLAKRGRNVVEEKWTWVKVDERYKELIKAS
jgi:glycosyltransferase involved in cell wall biosynthesis